MTDKKFKSVSLHEDNYREIEQLSKELTKEFDVPTSMATVINLAVKFYKQRRKFVTNEENQNV